MELYTIDSSDNSGSKGNKSPPSRLARSDCPGIKVCLAIAVYALPLQEAGVFDNFLLE
jgi:hypothetical protein